MREKTFARSYADGGSLLFVCLSIVLVLVFGGRGCGSTGKRIGLR